MRISRLLFCLVLLTAGLGSVLGVDTQCAYAGEDVSVVTSFDKRTVALGDTVKMTIKVSGAIGNLKKPGITAPAGFDLFYAGRSSKFDFINGRSVRVLSFTYELIPKGAGVFEIGPFSVDVMGQVYSTSKISITVLGLGGNSSSSQKTNTSSSRPARSSLTKPVSVQKRLPKRPVIEKGSESLFIDIELDKAEVFPNEQITITYTVYTYRNVRYEGFAEEPEVLGFWFEEIDDATELNRDTVMINGRKYARVQIRKIAAFATKPGEYTLNPGTVKFTVEEPVGQDSRKDDFFDDSFFGSSIATRKKKQTLKPENVSIIVKDFPIDKKPEFFNGAVGDYKLYVDVDKTAVDLNEPIEMTMKVQGIGNLEMLQRPFVATHPDFEVFDGETTMEMSKKGSVIHGNKTFRVTLIPKRAGQLQTPEIYFDFFHKKYKSYMSLKNGRIPVKVNGASQQSREQVPLPEELKEKIEVKTHDVSFIKTELAGKSFLSSLRVILLVIDLLLFFGLFFFIIVINKRRALEADVGLKRKVTALKGAKKQTKRLAKLKKSQDVAFFEEAVSVLNAYLADKLNVSSHGLTWPKIEKHLKSISIDSDVIANYKAFYDTCNFARFGAGKASEEAYEKVYLVLPQLIDALERSFDS